MKRPVTQQETQQGYTWAEFVMKFAPNGVLDRLRTRLCELLGLKHSWQYRVSSNAEDRRLGLVEVAKTGYWTLSRIEDHARAFYRSEGYTVENDGTFIRITNPHQESFWLDVQETETSFCLHITRPLFPTIR